MNRISSALVAALLFAGSAQAQERRNSKERVQDHQELRQDRRELRDDRRDLEALEAVLTRFDNAWARRSEREMTAVEGRLRELLRAELAEGRVELAADRGEARRSQRELRAERWDARGTPAWGRPGARADARRDVRDDRRDARDDKRDARVEAAAQRTRRAIARDLEEVEGLRQPGALHRKRTLIVELIGLAEQELNQGRQELREDRRELREDRRETREDRRRG